ncbi:hypothetical protein [Mariniradius sediminis]|uniref:Uncharacterized protein n=1 Tax=Mariniradius sediminis TaxID=2909237 RepID=A0ABS9BSI2_9BACT|nr:hypothetical protein [Mariniradius sediminis]MCF1750305.1 hypothetical protein [Mariniradius sediminis]
MNPSLRGANKEFDSYILLDSPKQSPKVSKKTASSSRLVLAVTTKIRRLLRFVPPLAVTVRPRQSPKVKKETASSSRLVLAVTTKIRRLLRFVPPLAVTVRPRQSKRNFQCKKAALFI